LFPMRETTNFNNKLYFMSLPKSIESPDKNEDRMVHYENSELRLDNIGQAIRKVRMDKQLTQEELGKLVGVKRAQISKIENSAKDARFDTIMKVFRAMDAQVNFNVEVKKQ